MDKIGWIGLLFSIFYDKLSWERNVLQYLFIHVYLNLELLKFVLYSFIGSMLSSFGKKLLFHQHPGFYHKVIIRRQVNLNIIFGPREYKLRIFDLLQYFRNLCYTDNLVLKLADQRIMEYDIAFYFLIYYWIESYLYESS